MKRIGINGLGRIGRLILHNYFIQPPSNIKIVAANDMNSSDDIAYLLKFDSVHGIAPFDIDSSSDYLDLKKPDMICDKNMLDNLKIKLFHEKDPSQIPWDKLDVDIVLECTGVFRRREDALKHLDAGASKVIISAPSDSNL